jgi:hypothetical protein
MHNPGIGFVGNELVYRIDIFMLAGTKAEVVEPRSVLIERFCAFVGGQATHENSGTATNSINDVLTLDECLHTQKVA